MRKVGCLGLLLGLVAIIAAVVVVLVHAGPAAAVAAGFGPSASRSGGNHPGTRSHAAAVCFGRRT